jgi:hypothetical protein
MSSVVQLGLDSKLRKLDIQIALKSRIANRHAKVGILGLGYVGLPLAQVFVRAGYKMLGLKPPLAAPSPPGSRHQARRRGPAAASRCALARWGLARCWEAPAGGRPGGTASGGACSQWKRLFEFPIHPHRRTIMKGRS